MKTIFWLTRERGIRVHVRVGIRSRSIRYFYLGRDLSKLIFRFMLCEIALVYTVAFVRFAQHMIENRL